MYFDTHVHLNSEQLYPDYQKYIQKALDAKVNNMVVIGFDLETSKKAVEIANKYDFIYAAVAIGPNDCKDTTDNDLTEIESYLTNPKVVAVGETGLDYYYDFVDKDKQQEIFKKHIALAKKYNKPLIIHCRDAYEDTYEMLKKANHRGIMHCYSGSAQMALRFVDINFLISLAGPVTFKNAHKPKEVAQVVPIDKLLIETDCPYLAPVPFRGKINEPANVIYISREIANQKKIDEEEVANITTANAKRIFSIR